MSVLDAEPRQIRLMGGRNRKADRVSLGDAVLGVGGHANVVEGVEARDVDGEWIFIGDEWILWNQQSVPTQRGVVHADELVIGDVLSIEGAQGAYKIRGLSRRKLKGVWHRFRIGGDHTYFQDGLLLHNASRYWVGGGSSANWNATGNTNWGSLSGLQDNASVPGSADDVFLDGFLTGASNGTISANITINSIDCTGYVNTLTHNSGRTLTIAGGAVNFKLSSGMTYTLGDPATSALSFAGTTGTTQITTNGKTVGNVTFNGASGTFQLQDNLTSTGTITLTNGTLDFNASDVSCVNLTMNAGTKTLTMTNRTLTLTGTGTLYTTTSVNTTVNNTGSTIRLTDSSATSRTFGTNGNFTTVHHLKVTAGTGTVNIGNLQNLTINGDLDFTGFSGTAVWNCGTNAITFKGNVTFASGMLTSFGTSTGAFNWNGASGTVNWTSNGVTINVPNSIAIGTSGGGATYTFADAYASDKGVTFAGGGSGNTLVFAATTHTLGGSFDCHGPNSPAGTVTMTNATINCAGNLIDFSSTNHTINASGSTLRMNGSGNLTFNGGGKTFATLDLAPSVASTTFSLNGGFTCDAISYSSAFPKRIIIASSTTITLTSAAGWGLNGVANSFDITLQGLTFGTKWTISCTSGTVAASNIWLRDSNATGGATFTADASLDAGDNNGWTFTNPYPLPATKVFGARQAAKRASFY